MRASAVESGTWQRSPSLSSASIISSKPRKSSTRCSARRPPMNGEVGDWQSKMPLEYSRALEPAGSKIAQGQARHEGRAHPRWGVLLEGFIPTKLSTGAWGGKLQQEQGGLVLREWECHNLPVGWRLLLPGMNSQGRMCCQGWNILCQCPESPCRHSVIQVTFQWWCPKEPMPCVFHGGICYAAPRHWKFF